MEATSASRPRKVGWLWSYLSRNQLNIVSFVLVLFSLFYFLRVETLRIATLANHPEYFSDVETVLILQVIDGDELRIQNSRGSTRIRLLGIKSFDATGRDLLLAEYGKMTVDLLTEEYVDKRARLEISPKGVDEEGRLLGTLYVAETDEDIAKTLVKDGFTLVYTRYDFAKMDEYLKVQDEARDKELGLWWNERVTARADSLQKLWEEERKDR